MKIHCLNQKALVNKICFSLTDANKQSLGEQARGHMAGRTVSFFEERAITNGRPLNPTWGE